MLLSNKPKKVAKKELVPLILTICTDNADIYKDLLLNFCEDLGHAPTEEDFTEEIMMGWRATYCNSVADSTVGELNDVFPGFKEKYQNVLADPFAYGFDLDLDELPAGIPAGILFMICNYVLTGKVITYGSARPLSVQQTEIMNKAIIDAFESLPEEYGSEEDTI